MSEKKKVKENTEQKEQKVVTKYDLKMQKRKEQKEREKKQDRISMIIGVVVLIALVCLVASFPIRTYLATHETYVKVNGENVTRVEFDYNYNLAMNNYINQYGSYMSYFGFNAQGDLSKQMYSDTLSWKDFFEQMAVDNIKQNKALKAQAQAAGFTYDTSEEYAEFEQALKDAAAAGSTSVKAYVKDQYGPYATIGRVSDYIKEAIFLNAYYEQVMKEKTPSDEELEAHYKEDPDIYDSVDYRMTSVAAQLPTEPTELADPVEGSGAGTAADGTAANGAAAGTEQAYQPSQAEIDKAMADAKEQADAVEAVVAQTGALTENGRWNSTTAAIREWLFDTSRKAGDTTVIEDTTSNSYYVVAFEKRYRNETPSVDARVLITDSMDGQAILDEWKSGEATEESFGELCKQYSIDSTAADGGLYEEILGTGMDELLAAWLYDEARQPGDTTSIINEDGNTYVMYYVAANDPEWKLDAKNTLLSKIMSDYTEEITADVTVEDPNGKLNYLKVQAAAEEGTDGTESTGAAEGTESEAGNSGTEESVQTEVGSTAAAQ